jgi:hypothetical protein
VKEKVRSHKILEEYFRSEKRDTEIYFGDKEGVSCQLEPAHKHNERNLEGKSRRSSALNTLLR